MKTFLAIFTCAENSENHKIWKLLDTKTQEARRKEGAEAMDLWMSKYKHQIIYNGGPLGDQTKKVDNLGVVDRPSKLGAFLVVQAISHDKAAEMFLNHPHFAIFPGDGVDIVERADRLNP